MNQQLTYFENHGRNNAYFYMLHYIPVFTFEQQNIKNTDIFSSLDFESKFSAD